MKSFLFRWVPLIFIATCQVSVAENLRVVVVADLNGQMGKTDYRSSVLSGIDRALEKAPDLVIGTGDYVAGEDISHKFPLSRFEAMWATFERDILQKFLTAGVEFAPSPGNHDASGYSVMKRERDLYQDFWNRKTPRVQFVDQRFYPLYYSYVKEDVFFISMDNVTPFRIHHGDTQRDWIRQQLQSPQARQAKARIVYGHIPLYPLLDKDRYSKKGRGKYHEVLNREQWEENPDGLEKLFLDENVNLAIFGHSHAFYPGKVIHRRGGSQDRVLRILSMPCMGSGARYLEGQSDRSKTGFAVVDINGSGNISVQGYLINGDKLDHRTLPERVIVPGQSNRYYRDDINWE